MQLQFRTSFDPKNGADLFNQVVVVHAAAFALAVNQDVLVHTAAFALTVIPGMVLT